MGNLLSESANSDDESDALPAHNSFQRKFKLKFSVKVIDLSIDKFGKAGKLFRLTKQMHSARVVLGTLLKV